MLDQIVRCFACNATLANEISLSLHSLVLIANTTRSSSYAQPNREGPYTQSSSRCEVAPMLDQIVRCFACNATLANRMHLSLAFSRIVPIANTMRSSSYAQPNRERPCMQRSLRCEVAPMLNQIVRCFACNATLANRISL